MHNKVIENSAGLSMRFLLIASFAESLVTFRGQFIVALQARGFEVHVAAPGIPEGSAARSRLEALGVVAHNIKLQRTGTSPFADLYCLAELYSLLQATKPHYVLAYTAKPIIYGLMAARMARVPSRTALITGLGYAFQDGGRRGLVGKLVKRLYAMTLKNVQHVIFQNPDDELLFREAGILGKQTLSCVVNGSGVDLEHFKLTPPASGGLRFIMIARLLGNKGVREYVEAARQIRRKYPDVGFDLAGWIDDGPDSIHHTELDSWIADNTISFLGRLDDVRPAIAESSVFVLPSYREGTPRTVLEAMAMGRAIITTSAPGCRETVVDGEGGFLVPIRSAHSLSIAMEKFVLDRSLATRMGLKSRQLAEAKYNVHIVNQHMLDWVGIS